MSENLINSKEEILEGAYKIPKYEEMCRRFDVLEKLWNNFLKSEGQGNLKYYIHKQNLFEVIKRQDQRMYYFKIFHGLNWPCEYKYVAVECFWINTLKPFIVLDEKSPIYDCPNEKFSLFLIISTIMAMFEIYKKGKVFTYPSTERIHEILYDFKYCSMSREAVISFVETFADTYGLGIDFILNKEHDIKKALRKNGILELWEDLSESPKLI